MIFVLWIIIWLILNYIFWWFSFNTLLCFLVGIFLIMPVLLKISFKELKNTFKNKKVMWINVLINFIIIPLIAFLIWYFIFWLDNYPYIFTIVLLWIIPGWWLLMNWLNHTKADLHIGFSLFAINLFIFSFVFIGYNLWTTYFVNKYNKSKTIQSVNNNLNKNSTFKLWTLNNNLISNPLNIPTQEKKKQLWCAISEIASKVKLKINWCNLKNNSTLIYGFTWFIALILIPFILSRIIIFFLKWYIKTILKYVNYVSKILAFMLIVYIFSLSYIRDILNITPIIVIKSVIAVVVFYIILYIIIKLLLRFSNIEKSVEKSIFWNAFTRFITLTLVLSILYAISWHTPWIIIIPIIVYFVQIIFASLISMYYDRWKF